MNREDKIAVGDGAVLVELLLEDAAPNFNLEKAICSHGLFMMAPNHWDPCSKTLKRPLRLNPDDDETSLMVHVSQPPHALHLRIFGTHVLSPLQLQSLLSQVRRMLRLSEEENRRVIEFHKVHEESKWRGFERVFRSPTLFEDMIKYSETIRHLKQVHAKSSTIRTVKGDIEEIYEKYAPFQFLAYWSKVCHFYEEWFGNLSKMPRSNYKLITAANMRPKTKRGCKRMKLSPEDIDDGFTTRMEV